LRLTGKERRAPVFDIPAPGRALDLHAGIMNRFGAKGIEARLD